MIWQDVILTITSLSFSYALIPQIYHGFKTKRKMITFQTAIITSLGLYAAGIVYFSLNLSFATITTLIAATLWFILFIQSIFYRK